MSDINKDYPQIRRLWRELGSMPFVAHHFGCSKTDVCMACFGFPSPQAWRVAQDAVASTREEPC